MTIATTSTAHAASDEGASAQATQELLIARLERLPWTPKHWGIAAVLWSATVFDGYDGIMVAVVLPMVIASFGISLQQGGLLIGAAFLGQAIGSLSAGLLAERFGRRTVLMGSCVIMGVCGLAAALAQDLNTLVVARAIQGIGIGAEIPIAVALFHEFVKGKIRGFAVAAFESGFSWGSFLAPLLGLAFIPLVGQNLAWHVMFAVAGLSLAILFFRNRVLPESPRWLLNQGRQAEAERVVADLEQSARQTGLPLPEPVLVALPKVQKTNYLELFSKEYRLRTVTNWIMWVTSYSYGYGFYAFLTTMYVTVGGLPVTGALTLSLITSALTIPWQYTWGTLFDRVGRKPIICGGLLWSGCWLAIGAVLTGVFGWTSWPVLFAIGSLVVLGTAPISAGGYVYTPEQFPTRMRAWAIATSTTWIRAVSTVMPILMGTILASSVGLTGAWIVSAVPLLLGGLWVTKFGIETRGRVLEELAA